MKLIQLSVIDKRLFIVDEIPFRQVVTATNLQSFTNRFLFRETEIGEDENHNLVSVTMKMGEYKYSNKIYPIDRLIIDRTSILININGDTEIANQFYQEIAQILSEIDLQKQFKEDNFKLKTTQTQCVVAFDFNFDKLFSNVFLTFLRNDAKKICASAVDNKAKIDIIPRSLSFNVTYKDLDQSLLDNNIQILSKPLTIEPRLGTAPTEKIYYTLSPTDSKTHLHLIELLENQLRK